MISSFPVRTVLGFGLVALVGCSVVNHFAIHAIDPQGLQPEADPGSKAVLVYADSGKNDSGPHMTVDLVHAIEGDRETISLKSGPELLEKEVYSISQSEFGLVTAAGEDFSPPVTLIKFPFKLGDSYQWQGTLSDPIERKAEAKITTSQDQVLLGGQGVPAVLVTADISIDGSGSQPAKRTLKFWIAQGKGVVQRDFAMGVKRIPPP